MRTLVIGSLGRQGRRYCSILHYLNAEFIGTDISIGLSFPKSVNAVIIAASTAAHADLINTTRRYYGDIPVLCEKPVAAGTDTNLSNVYAVNQYAFLPRYPDFKGGTGLTAYNYFQSGADGLAQDCTSLIGLANGRIELKNDSPVWKAQINGVTLDIGDMDAAYVAMIESFLKGDLQRFWGANEIRKVAEKVSKLEKLSDGKSDINWNPSEIE